MPAVLLASLCVTLPIPFLSASRFGDLCNWYNDHLHHAFATWVFLHRGLAIYTEPFRTAASVVRYPHRFLGDWADNPGMVYPPGVFVVFLPMALLGSWLPDMSMHAFGATGIAILLFYAHLTFGVFLLSSELQPRGLRVLVAGALWLALMRAALDGFFDVVWLGAAAAMQLSLLRAKPSRALVWFAAAAFTHFRAIVMAPLAVDALRRAIGRRPARDWPWGALSLTAGLLAIAGVSFLLMYPVTANMRGAHPSTLSQIGTLRFWEIGLSGVLLAAGAYWSGGLVAAVTSALVSVIALAEMTVYPTFWWHSSVCFAVLMLPGAVESVRRPAVLRVVGLVQLFALEALVWADRRGGLFGLFAEFLNDFKLR
ncbi:MAG TPA: hypothetical protein VE987_05340 [Polyangiaceae bacterium]|nr:hypothetical protein [Polyangiaceae bacterium]